MGDDHGAGFRKRLIGPGVVPVPMRVEKRLHASPASLGPDPLEQLFGTLGRTAVDQQQPVMTSGRDDIAARALEQP